jgi:CRISPR-associated protein Cmr5
MKRRFKMKTLNQKYASVAFKYIEEVEKKPNLKKDYLSRVRKLPSMITHNGLLTTLTFLYSKAKGKTEASADGLLLKQLVKFLERTENESEFIRKLAEETDFKTLKLYTRRALNFSQWLKRLAEGTFGEEEK